MDFEDLGSRPKSKHASPRHAAPGFLLLSLLFNTFKELGGTNHTMLMRSELLKQSRVGDF